ncbi:MAG: hypothetical protein HN929_11450 [Chloroflexi bacterium]|nr:hypothetical protein [Chloroflexota bacterium]
MKDQELVEKLRGVKNVQCTHGNWDYDPYMRGMANGLILAVSVLDDTQPEYLDAPTQWLRDLPKSEVIAAEE